mmetsp:Transcript_150650/g.482058  ORF Transcript_150650/g.482058 Transcript_150650/m.482058 type:complete len:134 (+) Transcript_150650:66-467(+)
MGRPLRFASMLEGVPQAVLHFGAVTPNFQPRTPLAGSFATRPVVSGPSLAQATAQNGFQPCPLGTVYYFPETVSPPFPEGEFTTFLGGSMNLYMPRKGDKENAGRAAWAQAVLVAARVVSDDVRSDDEVCGRN